MEEELKSLHLCPSHTTLKPLISDTLLKYSISKVAVAGDLDQWGFQKKSGRRMELYIHPNPESKRLTRCIKVT